MKIKHIYKGYCPDDDHPDSRDPDCTACLEMQRMAVFQYGDRVRKKSGSKWQGRVVGWYSTALTPEGYAVESEAHAGSVQIYPAKALEIVPDDKTNAL